MAPFPHRRGTFTLDAYSRPPCVVLGQGAWAAYSLTPPQAAWRASAPGGLFMQQCPSPPFTHTCALPRRTTQAFYALLPEHASSPHSLSLLFTSPTYCARTSYRWLASHACATRTGLSCLTNWQRHRSFSLMYLSCCVSCAFTYLSNDFACQAQESFLNTYKLLHDALTVLASF